MSPRGLFFSLLQTKFLHLSESDHLLRLVRASCFETKRLLLGSRHMGFRGNIFSSLGETQEHACFACISISHIIRVASTVVVQT